MRPQILAYLLFTLTACGQTKDNSQKTSNIPKIDTAKTQTDGYSLLIEMNTKDSNLWLTLKTKLLNYCVGSNWVTNKSAYNSGFYAIEA
jgi:hypothetical protein